MLKLEVRALLQIVCNGICGLVASKFFSGEDSPRYPYDSRAFSARSRTNYFKLATPLSTIYIVQSADMHVSAFYASSVQLGTHPHMWLHCTYTRELCSHQAHAVQHNTTNTCGHAQSVIGPECSNDLKGSGLCIIAFRHLLRSARVLNNTEYIYIYIYIYMYIYIYIYIYTPQKLTTTACFVQEESSGGRQCSRRKREGVVIKIA